MTKIMIKHCKQADKEHKASLRQYAHVGHIKGNVICVAKAFIGLPKKFKLGLIGHELGHWAGAIEEKEADKVGSKIIGMKIKRIDSKYGLNLEVI